MTATIVYGIATCDQVRRARAWLRSRAVDHAFHDVRAHGLPPELLARWLTRVPWDALLNRRGTTWRALPAERRAAVVDQASAIDALLAEPTLLKRPVVESDDRLLVGFSEAAFAGAFGPPEGGPAER